MTERLDRAIRASSSAICDNAEELEWVLAQPIDSKCRLLFQTFLRDFLAPDPNPIIRGGYHYVQSAASLLDELRARAGLTEEELKP